MKAFKNNELWVKTASRTYPIHIVNRSIPDFLNSLFEKFPGKKIGLVTDNNLFKLYRRPIESALKKYKSRLFLSVIPAGEKSKNRRTKEKLEDFFLSRQFDRKSVLVALGGGVVGDLTGYTAATLFRGIDFIQVPSSLLAMVDSSVGGKTGVDTPHGKNLIGSFHQPVEVLVNLGFLKTLPDETFLEGMGEILKAAFIASRKLHEYLLKNREAVLKRDPAALLEIIEASLKIKRDVVGKDEKETGGLRRILNYGHTIGHAVELLAHFRLSHGFCVAIGMAAEARLGVRLGILKESSRAVMESLLADYGLPVRIPKTLRAVDLYNAMLLDKKSVGGQIQFALCSEIGKMERSGGTYAVSADKKTVLEILGECGAK